jgi:hypothetical protein
MNKLTTQVEVFGNVSVLLSRWLSGVMINLKRKQKKICQIYKLVLKVFNLPTLFKTIPERGLTVSRDICVDMLA